MKNEITLEEVVIKIDNLSDGEFLFIREDEISIEVVGKLIKKYSLFLGPMSPDHWEFKIYNKLGVVENNNWTPINENTMPLEWREANGIISTKQNRITL